MLDFINITKALTDENRVRILMALRGRELCVCQITAFLDLAPSTTSKHLSVLRQARLIESRKHGKWVYYTLPENVSQPSSSTAAGMAAAALLWVMESLGGHPAINEDEERISHILEQGEKAICNFEQDNADAYHSPEIHSLEDELNAKGF